MTVYHFVAASEAFLCEEEPLAEVLRERVRHYGENGREIDFWLVRHPAFLESPQLAGEAAAVKSVADHQADLQRRILELESGLKLMPSAYDADRHQAILKRMIELAPGHERYLALADAERRIAEATAVKEAADRELGQARQRYAELKEQRANTGFATLEDANAARERHERHEMICVIT